MGWRGCNTRCREVGLAWPAGSSEGGSLSRRTGRQYLRMHGDWWTWREMTGGASSNYWTGATESRYRFYEKPTNSN